MNIKNFLKQIFAGIAAVAVMTAFAGCKEKTEDTASSVQSQTSSESTVSVLLPVEATFPEEYTTMIPVGDGESHDIKGNTALKVDFESSKVYDPVSYEGADISYSFKTSKGFGCGSNCSEFLESYGVKRGYYTAFDSDGEAVDITAEGNGDFTVMAMLSFNEQDGKITYLPGGKITEYSEGMLQGGYAYISSAGIGTDLLVITLFVNSDLSVDTFDIAHYII